MGKGSKRRPTHVDEETFAERWERTFGEDDEEEPETPVTDAIREAFPNAISIFDLLERDNANLP